jgi:hypothetical protein
MLRGNIVSWIVQICGTGHPSPHDIIQCTRPTLKDALDAAMEEWDTLQNSTAQPRRSEQSNRDYIAANLDKINPATDFDENGNLIRRERVWQNREHALKELSEQPPVKMIDHGGGVITFEQLPATDEWTTRGIVELPVPHIRITPEEREQIIARIGELEQELLTEINKREDAQRAYKELYGQR